MGREENQRRYLIGTMKTITGLVLFFLATSATWRQTDGFINSTPHEAIQSLTMKTDKMRDGIAHELFEELDLDIKTHLEKERKKMNNDRESKGFGEHVESLNHKLSKLRKELKERDLKYQQQISELREEIKAYKVAYQMEQTIANEDEVIIEEYKEENDSIRRLLWQCVKLVGKRIHKFYKKFERNVKETDQEILSHYY